MRFLAVLLPLFLIPFFANTLLAATTPTDPGKPSKSANQIRSGVPLKKFTSLTPRQLEKMTGVKLRLKEKLALKITQLKLKKHQAKDEPTDKQRKMGIAAMILGALSLILIFTQVGVLGILGVVFAIAGFILGVKSIKDNGNIFGVLGVAFSAATLFLLLLAVILVSAWGWW